MLDAHLDPDGAHTQVARTTQGTGDLVVFCKQHRVDLVVMEATGGYERLPFAHLWGEGIAVAIVDPRAVRRFAQSMGMLEKTDRIDCAMIAWFARTKAVAPTPPASEAQQRLTALTVRLRQLTELRTAQRNQRRLVTDTETLASFTDVMAVLTRQIRRLERLIGELIATDPLWAALETAFREIKGVGARTSARLLAQLPEIGQRSGKANGKLVGLAPLARDSGQKQGRRAIRGGREGVRSILYYVGGIVARYDPDFRAFAQRLRAAGKPPKVVRTAVAHKLLIRLNAKARDVRRLLSQPVPAV
jgi:transposase